MDSLTILMMFVFCGLWWHHELQINALRERQEAMLDDSAILKKGKSQDIPEDVQAERH